MKRAYFFLALLFSTYFSHSQSLCDSITFELTNLGGGEISLQANFNLPTGVLVDSVDWKWTACDTSLCYENFDSIGVFTQLDITGTLYVMLQVTIYGEGDTCEYTSLKKYYIYDHGWVYHHTQNPISSIVEIKSNQFFQNRIFDLLGREYKNEKSIPLGSMYIKDKRKIVKVKD